MKSTARSPWLQLDRSRPAWSAGAFACDLEEFPKCAVVAFSVAKRFA